MSALVKDIQLVQKGKAHACARFEATFPVTIELHFGTQCRQWLFPLHTICPLCREQCRV